MKKSPFTSTILASFLLCTVVHAELVSYWPLDETEGDVAVDMISGNDAEWQNPGFDLEWIADGRIGGAASLTETGGFDNFFRIESIDQLIDKDGLTITLWMNPEAQSSSAYNGVFMTRTINGAENNSWGIAYQDNQIDTRVNGPGIDSVAGSVLPDGGWYHVALVWDGVEGLHTQYINGEESSTGSAIFGEILDTSGPWYIGYDDCCGGNRDFDGQIDDIGVWNEALSVDKIALLAGGVSPPNLDDADLDGDGIPNEYEEMFEFLDPLNPADAALDEDEDGLSNLGEVREGTDPTKVDSDEDGLSDGIEVNDTMTNPKIADTDGDSLSDGDEVNTHKTSPVLKDSDSDGIDDAKELADGTDPNDALSPTPPERGLIAYWSLDEGEGEVATDSVGGTKAVWQNEGVNLEWVDGQIGGAARLTDTGGDNFFLIESIEKMIGAPALTISAWIDPDEQQSSGYNGIFMTRTINGATNNSWGIAMEGEHIDARVNGPGIDSSDLLDTEDGWYHVVLVWNSEELTYTSYVNGVEEASGAVAETVPSRISETSGPWYIGYDDCCGGTRDFDGVIDDIGIWDKALSAEEIEALYNNGLEGIGAGGGSAPLFQFTAVSPQADGTVALSWTSRSEKTYSLRYSFDLSAGISEWIEIDDGIESEGDETSFITPAIGDAPREVYFVVIES